MNLERNFQPVVIQRLQAMLPGAIVYKNAPFQGFPDVMVLYKHTWAVLECKRSPDEPFQPNQRYYLDLTNEMSFSRVVFPENLDKVLEELYAYFTARTATCVSWG